MTVGKVKIAALKLMFEGSGEEHTVSGLLELASDDSYRELISAMPESINRGIDRFFVLGLLPPQEEVPTPLTVTEGETEVPPEVQKVRYVDDDTEDTAELDIPEVLSRMLPYFLKAEIMEEDDPQKASFARNIFENNLAEYRKHRPDRVAQTEITLVL